MKKFGFIVGIAGLFYFIYFGVLFVAFAETNTVPQQTASSSDQIPPDIKKQIDEKNQALKQISEQKQVLETGLDQISKSKDSLSNQVKMINANIDALNLSVTTNKLTIEKINLELQQMSDSIPKIEENIVQKREAIKQLLLEMQTQDQESTLGIILKNRTLSDNVSEIQNLADLNTGLAQGIKDMYSLEQDLKNKIAENTLKKTEKNTQQIDLINQQYIIQEQKAQKEDLLNTTKNQESIYQKQISILETQQETIANEIEGIESALRKKINPNLLPVTQPLFIWPVPDGKITQGYGNTAFALRAYKGKWHNGIDIDSVPIGTEIFAADAGIVINVGDQDKFCRKGAYGRFVVVKHYNGLTTLYGHMSKYIVSIGDQVERGQVIGYIGSTGYATGPHLHFTVFASQTLAPARPGFPEGSEPSRTCGPMPIGGDLNPLKYF